MVFRPLSFYCHSASLFQANVHATTPLPSPCQFVLFLRGSKWMDDERVIVIEYGAILFIYWPASLVNILKKNFVLLMALRF